MVRHLSQGNRSLGAGADRQVCCWPTCSTVLDDRFPLCPPHSLDAYMHVKLTVDMIFEQGSTPTAKPPTIGKREGYVYFLRFRDRVKIGFTTCLVSRFTAIPHDEVLGYVPGTMADEKRCHAAFAHLRENGEWFRPAPDLLAFIESVDKSDELAVETGAVS